MSNSVGSRAQVPRRLALSAVALFSVVIVACCVVGGSVAELGFAMVAMAFPVALMLLGVARGDGRRARAVIPILLLLALLEACLAGMLIYRGQVVSGPWTLGLPVAAAIQIYGIFIAPLALVAVGYALTFGELAVDEKDLERLRRAGSGRSSGD
jgi:hypothetical protein